MDYINKMIQQLAQRPSTTTTTTTILGLALGATAGLGRTSVCPSIWLSNIRSNIFLQCFAFHFYFYLFFFFFINKRNQIYTNIYMCAYIIYRYTTYIHICAYVNSQCPLFMPGSGNTRRKQIGNQKAKKRAYLFEYLQTIN